MTDVLVAGDFYVGRGFAPAVDESVCELIKAARHALVNLEAAITETTDRIEKTGQHLTMPVSSLDHLKRLGFTALALANNHILDAGLPGLEDTLKQADEHGFLTVGSTTEVGGARSAARVRLPLSEGSLTVLNYCEHEWSVREDGVGASGWHVLDAYSDIKQAQSDGDRVLVVLHGGNEYFPLPRPGLRKELRFLAENGADAIVMHHSHVPAAYEVWNEVPIFYGLGNFQFTQPNNHTAWREGLLLNLSFPQNDKTKFDITSIRQSKQFDVRLASPKEREETINELEGYRLQVASDDALFPSWNEFTSTAAKTFAEGILPASRLRPKNLRRLIEVSYSRIFLGDLDARKAAFNYIRCESHNEALKASLQSGFR
jgi:poly-gamma-glutamate synthesis protein (capsule biosynthesis protein)